MASIRLGLLLLAAGLCGISVVQAQPYPMQNRDAGFSSHPGGLQNGLGGLEKQPTAPGTGTAARQTGQNVGIQAPPRTQRALPAR